MLVALFTIFFLGGGSPFGPMLFIDDAMKNTKTVIVDKDQQKEVKASLKAIKKRAKQYNSDVKKNLKALTAEDNAHEVSPEAIEAFWTEVFELNDQFSQDFLEMRFALRDQVSREEWAGIFPSDAP